MSYLALYRKYRPLNLDEVVGQKEVKDILKNSILNNTISHAYLFSGSRGTGKTSIAKIFAKMVNCEHPVDGHCCNECKSCKEFATSGDLIEIDAASNNGVDEIRDLKEKVNLVPAACKYKVYIIDEVHMLTIQAFNALLKTLEEPPKHVIFILATTEYHKIPLTITSRCQKFQFNKISINEMIDRLKFISSKENILIDDDAISEICKISDGGMRDAVNMLDQVRSFTNSKIDINTIYEVCGNFDSKTIFEFISNLKNNDYSYYFDFFEIMNKNGKNYLKFFDDLLNFLNNLVVYKNNFNSKYFNIDLDILSQCSKILTIDDIMYLYDKLNLLVDRIKNVSNQSIYVLSNFLPILGYLNDNSNVFKLKEQKYNDENECKINKIFYKKNNINNFDDNSSFDNCKCKNLDDNFLNDKFMLDDDILSKRNIIINNAFATANKNIKNDLIVKFKNLDKFLLDNKFSDLANIFIDSSLEVAGDKFLIINGKFDSIVNKFYKNYDECINFLKILFDNFYYVAFINNEEWSKYKNDYVSKVKSGYKYEILQFINKKNNDVKINESPVDELIDIIGSDLVEYR